MGYCHLCQTANRSVIVTLSPHPLITANHCGILIQGPEFRHQTRVHDGTEAAHRQDIAPRSGKDAFLSKLLRHANEGR